MLPLSASSCAAPVGTSRVTAPSVPGVTVAVHTVPVVVSRRFDAVPLPTWMSDSANPLTASLKVNVTSNAAFCGVVGPAISTGGVATS